MVYEIDSERVSAADIPGVSIVGTGTDSAGELFLESFRDAHALVYNAVLLV